MVRRATRHALDADRTTPSRGAGPSVLGPLSALFRPWRARETVVACLAAGISALLLCHRLLPNPMGIGTLVDSFAPWLGVAVPLVALPALLSRCRAAVLLLVPALIWGLVFGTAVPANDRNAAGGVGVVTQNLYASNSDPKATLRDLSHTDADLVGLQEITSRTRSVASEALRERYPHHITMGTVGLWSRYRLSDVRAVDLGLGWTRAVRAVAHAPQREIAVYVAHLPSLRPDSVEQRDRGLRKLATAVAGEAVEDVVLLGDLNTATTDRALRSLTRRLPSVAGEATAGFGFTWPDAFPAVRLDHVLSRGVRVTDAEVVDTRGSDHRAVRATLSGLR
ncbi:vancomycin resistance protein VanJ [Actinopolyspora alba]|uniref:Vancomycin resistance protein VanJ n=1 Tax=Actinopolyspora alba TaxID=673379 RepID=A0A1I1ZZC5_9ACTN|nr:endonuclease/exonuclease/phosphatase family protein [Actinopolyspora alba]SFE37015.1 vancomycin resistance protein VanJ [Actinopolyspora alba]